MCSVCPPRAETQAARRLRYCFMALSISCWSILSHSLSWFFLQKCHNYVIAQTIFNRFCQNQITISWYIHLQIFAESFIKICPKTVRNICKNKCITFFWTRYISPNIRLSMLDSTAFYPRDRPRWRRWKLIVYEWENYSRRQRNLCSKQ